jgi:hypothetical protein
VKQVLKICGSALQDIWGDVWSTAVINLLWIFCVVLIIPGPPATLALFAYGNRLANGETADLNDFLRGIRRFWKAGWRWGFLNLGLILILVGDITLLGSGSSSQSMHFFQGCYFTLLSLWLLLQLFVLPFLVEQDSPRVRTAVANAAAMLGRNIGFTLGLWVSLLIILFIGSVLFLISLVAGGVFISSAANRAVLNRLEIQVQSSPRNREKMMEEL